MADTRIAKMRIRTCKPFGSLATQAIKLIPAGASLDFVEIAGADPLKRAFSYAGHDLFMSDYHYRLHTREAA